MTRAEVLALSSVGASRRAAEAVLGWTRVAKVAIENGGETGPGWMARGEDTPTEDAEGAVVPTPVYKIVPQVALPDFASDEHWHSVVQGMVRAGYECRLRSVGKNVSCAFSKTTQFPPVVDFAAIGEAVLRAALVAVLVP